MEGQSTAFFDMIEDFFDISFFDMVEELILTSDSILLGIGDDPILLLIEKSLCLNLLAILSLSITIFDSFLGGTFYYMKGLMS